MTDSERFQVRVETRFLASHTAGPAGEAQSPHEHEWQAAVTVESAVLDRIAIVVDFRRLRADTEALVDEIRGTRLQDHPAFAETLATPPLVARWLRDRLARKAAGESYRIVEVEVGCDPGVSFTVTSVPPTEEDR